MDVNSDFYTYYKHYDIGESDPENMPVPDDCDETIAQYHFHYLCELFRYRKIRYTKSRPNIVATSEYFYSMRKRIEHTEHLKSFAKFIDFIIEESNT